MTDTPAIDRRVAENYPKIMTDIDIAVATHGVTKIYGKAKRVDGVSLTVRRGEIYGLIGKNGAGKTTLIRMLLGIAAPDGGTVEINGGATAADLARERAKCGALIEQPAFYPRMSAKGNLKAYALATGLGKTDADGLLSLVGLGDCGKKQVRNFSLGMKQRLAISMALTGDPEILFLDEPVNGLDPTGILQVRELIKRLNEERGTTVIISSHLLGELGRVATAYGVMKDGRLVAELRGEQLASLARPRIKAVVAEKDRAERLLAGTYGAGSYAMRGNTAEIFDPSADIVSVTRLFADNGVALMQIGTESGDLESAFVDML